MSSKVSFQSQSESAESADAPSGFPYTADELVELGMSTDEAIFGAFKVFSPKAFYEAAWEAIGHLDEELKSLKSRWHERKGGGTLPEYGAEKAAFERHRQEIHEDRTALEKIKSMSKRGAGRDQLSRIEDKIDDMLTLLRGE